MINILWTVVTSFWFWLLAGVVSLVSGVLNLIPVPTFLEENSLTIPTEFVWFASVLEIQYGLSVVVSAYAIRFALRALPAMF